MVPFGDMMLQDGISITDAAQELERLGADVVGLNCGRGLDAMLPAIKQVRAVCKVRTVVAGEVGGRGKGEGECGLGRQGKEGEREGGGERGRGREGEREGGGREALGENDGEE